MFAVEQLQLIKQIELLCCRKFARRAWGIEILKIAEEADEEPLQEITDAREGRCRRVVLNLSEVKRLLLPEAEVHLDLKWSKPPLIISQ